MGKERRRGNNEGSIYQRDDDKRWVGVVNLGWEDGRRKRKYVYGENREDVQRRLTAAQKKRDDGIPQPDDKLTVKKLLDAWLADCPRRRLKPVEKPLTLSTYTTIVNRHITPKLGRIKVTKLTTDDIDDLLATKYESGLSARRVQMIREVLRNALNWAVAKDLVSRNVAVPATPPPRSPRKKTQFSRAQAVQFLGAVKGHRFETLFVTILTLGLRVGEALALRWTDIDDAEHTVKIHDSLQRVKSKGLVLVGLKNEASERELVLPDLLENLLQEHWLAQKEAEKKAEDKWQEKGFVFTTKWGTALDACRVYRSLQALIEEAKLPKIRVHDLRGSCATLLNADGLPDGAVMGTMGHAQIGTTMNIYVGKADESGHQAADIMNRLLVESGRS